MERKYQYNYSDIRPAVFDVDERNRKANTIIRVCQDFLETDSFSELILLDVGSSSGIIDHYLADFFGEVHGIDIDRPAIEFSKRHFDKPNLHYAVGDAMKLTQQDSSVDVVVCSHVYEHVPDASIMFAEIFRVLKPGGFCYFSGNNRVMLMEPHYRLPLLSLLPRPLAHFYMRVTAKGDYYHEKHLSLRSLKAVVSDFRIEDYSARIIDNPVKYGVDYMLSHASLKWRVARFVAHNLPWATPHIWLLCKPSTELT